MTLCRNCVLVAAITLAPAGCGTANEAANQSTAAHADRIAFVVTRNANNADLGVVNADGTRRQLLTDTPMPELYPDFSPDGTRLVFSATAHLDQARRGRLQLFSMPAEGGERDAVTDVPAERGQDLMPTWSPTGNEISFVSLGATIATNALWVTDVAGAAPPRAVMRPARVDGPLDWNSPIGIIMDPAFSPDGARLAFACIGGANGIFVVNVDGSGLQRLTLHANDRAPAWSPDGTRIAFTRLSGDQLDANGLPHSDLYVMNADGTQMRRLTAGLADESGPSWSPDGTRLAYAADGSSEPVPVGGVLVPSATPFPPIPTLPFATVTPQVAPSPLPPDAAPGALPAYPGMLPGSTAPGSQRAYPAPPTSTPVHGATGYPFELRLPPLPNDIYIIHADGTQAANVTNSREHESDPVWQP